MVHIGNLSKVIRWRVLMGVDGAKIPFSRFLMSHLAGQSLNMIYPARVGDLSRMYTIGDRGSVYVLNLKA